MSHRRVNHIFRDISPPSGNMIRALKIVPSLLLLVYGMCQKDRAAKVRSSNEISGIVELLKS